ncbi:hypothetical protein [Pseudotenacibaculum haliotis]|uniref:MFS transporter n=1 Tax=Pseudotenacibaculum haliotis TaxID=1862138 RepID=A0ABW5LPQ7_9FLAO
MYAPFLYLHAKIGQKGFGGYTYLNSFLWAIGYPLTGLSLGLLFLYYSKREKHDKKFRVFLSYGVMTVSMFYIVMAFFPKTKEYTLVEYNGLMFSIALLAVLIIVYISEKARLLEDTIRDKEKLKIAIGHILRVRNEHYKKPASKALYAEIHDEAMRNVTTVKEDSEDYDEDFIKTLKKIDD